MKIDTSLQIIHPKKFEENNLNMSLQYPIKIITLFIIPLDNQGYTFIKDKAIKKKTSTRIIVNNK